jgi:hypothetical protein
MPEVAVNKEPLWSRRLRGHAQKDSDFFLEARKRDGRVIPLEQKREVEEKIVTNYDGRKGAMTGRTAMRMIAPGRRTEVDKYRSVGVTESEVAATKRVNNHAFERLKADGDVEKLNSIMRTVTGKAAQPKLAAALAAQKKTK